MTDPGPRPLQTALIRWGLAALGALPLRVAHALAGGIGRLAALLPSMFRRAVETNLEIAFPELKPAERSRLIRETLAHQMRTMVEIGFIANRPREQVLGLVRSVSGEELVREAIASARVARGEAP